MPVTHLVDKVGCPRSVISAWSYAGHCSQETQSLPKVDLPTRKATAETGCSKGTRGRNSKHPGVTEGVSALVQDSTPSLAKCSVGSRSSLFNLEQRQGFGGRFSCRKSCGKILLENRKPRKSSCCNAAWTETSLHIQSYMIKLITTDHSKTEVVCVSFCAKTPWVTADQRIPSQRAPLESWQSWKALLSERGAFPQTPKIQLHCLSWCR